MKQFKFLALMLAGMSVLFACKKSDNDDDDGEPVPETGNVLKGTINENMTLTKDKVWILKGYVYVPEGVTLTIEKGTVVKSDTTEKGALTIERGAKLIADGTADEPIVFTSGRAAGNRNRGDWGGIVLLGKATTNRGGSAVIEGGLNRLYGGNDDDDNSGILRYVRIEYAGISAFQNSEINALTLGAVGRGTTIEHVQVSYANDDAYEFFGGTVNCKWLISYATSDDDYDFDFGYRGKIQYAVAMRDPKIADSDEGNGIEADNENPAANSEPYTHPQLSNFTFIGPNGAANTEAKLNYANRWRRHSQFELRNSILMGFPKGGFVMESDLTVENYKNGTSIFKNNLVHALTNPFMVAGSAVMTSAEVETKALGEGNIKYNSADDIKLTAPFNLEAPNYVPQAGSPALAGANFTGMDAFFTTETFRGAFGTTNWMEKWTSFSPGTNAY